MVGIILISYPNRSGSVYSLVDATFGAGFSLGPVFGSWLFSVGGFLLPFLVCGSSLLVTGLLKAILHIFLTYILRGDVYLHHPDFDQRS